MASDEWSADGARVVLMQLDPVTLAVVREIDLGRSRYLGGLRVGDGTVGVLVEVSPGSMGYATFDAVKVDASGREIASNHLDVPRIGTSILAHGRVFTIAFSRPGAADNEDTD